MKVEIHEDSVEVAAATASLIEDLISNPGSHSVGLAGGSTPKATYDRLATRDLDWGNVHFWLGDERWVPSESPQCNGLMVRQHLTDRVGGNLLQIDYSDDLDPDESAARYEDRLRRLFALTGDAPDVVLLGLGDDGHTASLFPGTEALKQAERDYVANYVSKAGMWRLTATIPLLRRASHIIFLVSGEKKAEAARLLVNPRSDDVAIPARLVAESAPDPIVMMDEAAASRTEGGSG